VSQGLFTLDDLRLVQAIAAVGTLTGAAQRLALDHSTAFRRLNAVEKRLGARLFERARDGYTPTEAGRAALETAARMLDDLDDLERRLAGEDLRPSGLVRVTTTDTLVGLLSGLFVALRAEQPEITIELIVANPFLTLRQRDADVAVRPARTVPDTLVGRRVASVAVAPYAAPSYLARQPDGTDLAAQQWIGFEQSLSHLAAAQWIAAHVAQERVVYRADSVLAVAAAARAGMGVAALPCYLGDADPALQRLGTPFADMAVPLWLLTHPDLKRVARIRCVLDFLARHIAEQRDLIEGRA
jgi:DNA-binding transcriptional LysR family regulator